MTIKNEVLIRVYIVLFLVVLVAIVIFSKAVRISVVEGDQWREMGQNKYVQMRRIEADRGNILSSDGSLLATSLPFFDVAFDPNSSGMSDADFQANIDSLAYCLATFVDPSFTPGGYRDFLVQKRMEKAQYVSIKRNVSFAEMQQIRSFPLFELGQFRGGMIATPKYQRDHPFGLLAHRTIGYVREGIKPVGLEGFYDDVLSGEAGIQPMVRVGEDIWKPVDDLAKIEPKAGKDIKTTIDVDIQDIAEEALFDALTRHDAEYGVAIVMEVNTGAIRAIANLGRTRNNDLWETYNHAVGSATEPGSTFKLATIMALLESGQVKLSDTIDLELGRTKFYEEEMVDAVAHGLEKTTVRTAFEQSSNVGMAKLVQQTFGEENKAEDFVNYLKAFNLNLQTGIEIEGEVSPFIKQPFSKDDDWSGTTLPWMSIGYEVMLTPLQLLNFYNTVANGGTMMKPYLVSEVQQFGVTLERIPPTIIKRRIASRSTIEQARGLLEGVVENGTASKLKSDRYHFAGKTGTAQLNYQRLKNRTKVGGYQATFVGYFPAEAPKYSCIVLISNPRSRGIYGGEVALPVFREIADKIFAIKLDLQTARSGARLVALQQDELPGLTVGNRQELEYLLDEFSVPYQRQTDDPVAVLRTDADTLNVLRRHVPEKRVPNVVGMGLKDALFLLENRGLRVEINGYGKVRQQSIKPGTPAKGQSITLRLG
ncbi:MAG: transpeptidase family protein [Saprospiraceae bacterium]|nr:transpeptidase family protein [Saprospiraceae bacterium]MCB0626322.1 transpeptidase family protein [Saprospiraceae bacterium]MCB0680136.1 transpeptidase family protein [Saprospiraceae bacterium]